jgi:hypothetical protein
MHRLHLATRLTSALSQLDYRVPLVCPAASANGLCADEPEFLAVKEHLGDMQSPQGLGLRAVCLFFRLIAIGSTPSVRR